MKSSPSSRPSGGPGRRPGGFQRPQRGNHNEPRVNFRIRVPEIRVVAEDGEQLGIMSTQDAQRRANELNLDLVEISPTARPPVCKIMDYGKFKYQQKRKAADSKRNQVQIELKEVKFRPKTDVHDFEVKVNRLKKFLSQGNKGKVTVMFRGREIVHQDIGRDILRRVKETLEEIAQVESHAKMEGRQMVMILAPIKGMVAKKKKPTKDPKRGPEQAAKPAEQSMGTLGSVLSEGQKD